MTRPQKASRLTVTALSAAALVAAAPLVLVESAAASPTASTTGATPTTEAGSAAQGDRHDPRGRHRPRHHRTAVGDPLVIGHRGAAGYRPEHTLASYELAARMGADFIEPDVVSTKDHRLVVRHENEIGGTTDVADHPEFADRKTTKTVDGTEVTGWFTEDFTLAELRTLRAKERLPQIRQENTMYNGMFTVPTLEQVLDLRERLSRELGRTIGVYPETKHPSYFDGIGLGLEKPLVNALRRHHLDTRHAPVRVQSFEVANLEEMRTALHLKAPEVLLASATGGPYADPEGRTYAELLKPRSLHELSSTIDGIGPDKNLVIDRNADGTLGRSTGLVDAAHAAGLEVDPYTFRAENSFLPADLRVGDDPTDFGRAITEDVAFMDEGVDGLFCDQTDVCVEARRQFHAGK